MKIIDWLICVIVFTSVGIFLTKNEYYSIIATSFILFFSGMFLIAVYFGLGKSHFVQRLHQKNKSHDGQQAVAVLWMGIGFIVFSIFWSVMTYIR